MSDSNHDTALLHDQVLDIEAIKKLIPHRYPFLLVDRILSWQIEPEKRLRAVKNVSHNEPFFQGHFPDHPVMPGVLIVEALAQACGVLAGIAQTAANLDMLMFYLVKVDNARFSKTVVPGDQLVMDVQQKRLMRNMGQYICEASVDGRKVASCELLCAGKER